MQLGETRWVADNNWHSQEYGLSWLVGGWSKFFVKGESWDWRMVAPGRLSQSNAWSVTCGQELARWRCIFWLAVGSSWTRRGGPRIGIGRGQQGKLGLGGDEAWLMETYQGTLVMSDQNWAWNDQKFRWSYHVTQRVGTDQGSVGRAQGGGGCQSLPVS